LDEFLKPKMVFKLVFPVLIVSEFIIDSDERDLAKPLKVNVVVHHGLCYAYDIASDSVAGVGINEIEGKIVLTPRSFLAILALWPCVLVRLRFQFVGEGFAALKNRQTRCNSVLQSNLFLGR
jgi:hypothetical protein